MPFTLKGSIQDKWNKTEGTWALQVHIEYGCSNGRVMYLLNAGAFIN